MSSGTPQDGHYVKRVVLPSGKTIEVVYFDTRPDEPPVSRSPEVPSRIQGDLHVCRDCDCDLVYPIEWDEADNDYWRVTLRCPNCEAVSAGVFPQDLVDHFDERLDVGTEQMVTDLKRLTRANMTDDIELFVEALAADAILPEDF